MKNSKGKIKETGELEGVVDEILGQGAIDRGNKFLHEETGMPLIHSTDDEEPILSKLAGIEPLEE